jgi:hypothetical protein
MKKLDYALIGVEALKKSNYKELVTRYPLLRESFNIYDEINLMELKLRVH